MNRKVVCSLLLALCVLLGCEKKPDEGPIRIGLIPYLKGEGRETTGLDMMTAANMAIEKLNRDGGLLLSGARRPLELVVVEIENNAEQAVAAARELINKHRVVAIVGPQYSSDAIPAGGVAEQSGVPMIAPVATHPDVTSGRRYVFRATFLDAQQAEAMAVFAREELKAKTAAIVFDVTDTYSKGLSADYQRFFTQMGGRVVLNVGVAREEILDARLWQRVAESGAETLYLPIYHPMSGKAADTARANGFKGLMLGSDSWDSRFDARLESMQGSYMTASWSRKLEMPATRIFIEEFTRRSRREPGDAPALTYDALMLLAQVIENRGETGGEALRQGLLEQQPFLGVAGSLDYVDSGNPVKPVLIIELRDGETTFRKFVVL